MTEPVLGTGLLKSRWFLIGVVEFELFFGLWLLSTFLFLPFGKRAGGAAESLPSPSGRGAGGEGLTWFASIALFSILGSVSLWKALTGVATCGCFGPLKVNPWYTTALDWALVVSLVIFRPRASIWRSGGHLPRMLRIGSVLAVWLAFGGPVGIGMASYRPATLSVGGGAIANGGVVMLEPERWVGLRFPLLPYLDVRDRLETGKWFVLLYHHGCPRCEEALRRYERLSSDLEERNDSARVALIEMPPCKKIPIDTEDSAWSRRFADTQDWFAATPAEIELAAGYVVSARTKTWFSGSPYSAISENAGGATPFSY